MPLMNVVEPLFLLLALTTVVALCTAAVRAASGQFARAGRILQRVGAAALLYFAVVVIVSIVSPRRVFSVGEPQCFDDWCITVVNATPTAMATGTRYDVLLRLSNRAKRVPMGEAGTVVYLTDALGRRFDPQPDPSVAGFDTRLPAGTSVETARRFEVPRDAQDVGLVYTHQGGFPIEWLIITEGGWFQKPPLVRFAR